MALGSQIFTDIIPQPKTETPRIAPPIIYRDKAKTQVDGIETLKANLASQPNLLVWSSVTVLEVYILWYLSVLTSDKVQDAIGMLNPVENPLTGVHWFAKLLNGGNDLSGNTLEAVEGIGKALGGLSRRVLDPVGILR